jgi:hypothetical protein
MLIGLRVFSLLVGLFLRFDVANTPYLTRFQSHFNALRVNGDIGQNVAHNAIRCFSRRLIGFGNDRNFEAGMDFFSYGSVHIDVASVNQNPAPCEAGFLDRTID